MRKFIVAFALMVFMASSMLAQDLSTVRGGLTSAATNCDSTSCVSAHLSTGSSSASVTLSGTFSGTVTFEASADNGASWSATSGIPWTGGAITSTATATGAWTFDVAGKTDIHARVSSYTSGTVGASIAVGTARANTINNASPQDISTTATPSFAGYKTNGVVNTFYVTTDFATAASTALQTITGLSFTLPANTQQVVPFQCKFAYSQATAAAVDSFGIQSATISPTSILATGTIYTDTNVFVAGNLTLTTTTATAVVTGTPAATATVYNAEMSGFIENPSNASANTINIMVKTATAADVITVKRGSYCKVF